MEKSRILLIEDDYALAMGTQFSLESEGFFVCHVSSLLEGKNALHQESTFDLILLDVTLPDGNGYEFMQEIKKNNILIPVIFLTALADESNIVQGLDLGADDYVTKPFRVRELVSRIRVVLRRNAREQVEEGAEHIYCFDGYRMDVNTHRLYQKEEIVNLTPSEFRLLYEMISHEGKVRSRTILLERLWDVDQAFVDDNTLSVYMKRLRDKLILDRYLIRTVRGVGYIMEKRS